MGKPSKAKKPRPPGKDHKDAAMRPKMGKMIMGRMPLRPTR